MRTNGFLSSTGLCRVLVLALLLANVGCGVTNGWALNRSGIRQYNRGHYAQARNRFARALRHDPCNPDYRHNLAMAVQKQGDVAASEQILRHNLTIDAMHQPTYHSLAQLMVTQGRAPEAQELVSTWAGAQPYVPEANIELAWLQRESGDTAGAEQSLQTALRADPANPIALSHLGQLYQGEGRPDQAVAYYQRSLAANWNQPEVQSRLTTLLEPRRTSRSALMQNSAEPQMVAGGPMFGDSMMAGAPMMTSSPAMAMSMPYETQSQAMAFTDTGSDSEPESRRARRHRRRDISNSNTAIANSYAPTSFDATANNWAPTGTIVGSPTMAYQADPMMISQTTMPMLAPPQMSSSSSSQLTRYSTGPTPLAQFDPAHASESNTDVTASLPVVDPH